MNMEDKEKRLALARQRIAELCEMVNAIDKARGGNGRKVRTSDYQEGI